MAIPVSSEERANNATLLNPMDKLAELEQRIRLLEKQGALGPRVAAIEKTVYGP